RNRINFEFVAGHSALDFCNTVHSRGAADPRDELKSYSDLVSWSQQAGLLNEHEAQPLRRAYRTSQATVEFKRSLWLRELIYHLFSGIAGNDKVHDDNLAKFNSYVREAMARCNLRRVGDKYELQWENHKSP